MTDYLDYYCLIPILKCSRSFDIQMLSDDEFDDGDEWDVLETIDSFDCDYNDCKYKYSRTKLDLWRNPDISLILRPAEMTADPP